MNLSILVPCFNEVENIPKIKNELLPVLEKMAREHSLEVIFIDDGSTDGTTDALNRTFDGCDSANISFDYRRHPTNLGLGAALKTGFARFTGEIVVTTDSDGTYKFETIPNLIQEIFDKDVDFITASPYHPQGAVVGVPKYRLILSQGASFLYRILVDWKIHTYTCLYRGYRRKVIDKVKFESDGFLAGTELMVKAILDGFTAAEFPAVLHRRTFGTSKAKLLRTILAHLRFQGWVILYRLGLVSIE